MEKIDDGLKALLESGKEKGYLTYSQVNDHLPDDAANPEKIDQLLILLEEQGIELIDEVRGRGTRGRRRRPVLDDEVRAELDLSFMDEDDSRRIDDPVRMYLTQMGEIPLLKREQEIALAKKIEVTRKRFRRKVLECDGALQPGGRHAQARPRRRPAVRPHRQGVADGEPGKGQDPPAHAAQPEDAGTPDGAEPGRLRQHPRSAHRRGRQAPAAPRSCASAAARPSRWSRSCRSARRRSSR